MSRSSIYKEKVESLLEYADVRIGGDRPWDLQIHNPDTYGRILGKGTIGFGETYMPTVISMGVVNIGPSNTNV